METNTERNCRVQKLYDELMAEGSRSNDMLESMTLGQQENDNGEQT